MLRTKHLVVIVTFACFGALGSLVFVYYSHPGNKETQSVSLVQFAEGERAYLVALETLPDKQKIRETFLEKIKSRMQSATVMESNNPITSSDENLDKPQALDGAPDEQTVSTAQISRAPLRGAVYACGGEDSLRGAETNTTIVDGAIMWQPSVSITRNEGARIIQSAGIPDHAVGIFPASAADDAFDKYGALTPIRGETFILQTPETPIFLTKPECVPSGMVGIALNGVPIYSGIEEHADARFYGAFDACGGHTDANGTYHYHNESTCLLKSYFTGELSTLLGYARDGFGIFASIEQGTSVRNEDLDACHGHTHAILWDGEMVNMYHYHFTDEFPYSVGCFMGAPAYPVIGG